MCGRFPGSVMIRITYPFDKVFLMVVLLAVIEDSFDFELIVVLDGYWGRWRRCWRAVCYGVRVGVWAEDRYMKDWVYLEGVGDSQFVCNG
jgi:hypothetical protein